MITIRLSRVGKRNNPFYRIVAAKTRSKRNGEFVDQVGSWDPKAKVLIVNKEKLAKLTSTGAVMSKAVDTLIKNNKK